MKLIKPNQSSEQGKTTKQIEFSSAVMFFSFLGIIFVFIWTSLSILWAIFATWVVCTILGLMFLYGAGIANKRYDEQTEMELNLREENIGIDTGFAD